MRLLSHAGRLALLGVPFFLGCGQNAATAPARPAVVVPAEDKIRDRIDEELDFIFERRLSIEEHAAWQILHGALAFKRDFMVDRGGQRVSAVDHILEGGLMKGWTVQPIIDVESDHRGLRAALELGSNTGQGHNDQWVAVLSQCDLAADQPIILGDETFKMHDFISQVLMDVPRNLDREFSWTLIALTTYLPTDYEWTASDGRQWSIPVLIQNELDHDLDSSACGGSHRMIGMSMALNRHLAAGGKAEGVWEAADQRIQEAVQAARKFQNPDGSMSTSYFASPGSSPDLAQNLGATGHTLEFLAISLTDEQLREPWVQMAVMNMCELFKKTRSVPLECGALYHAAHGLMLYRERVFGPRD